MYDLLQVYQFFTVNIIILHIVQSEHIRVCFCCLLSVDSLVFAFVSDPFR